MNYQDDEFGLIQLLGNLERVQGTFPPVYRSGDMLIGYDKQGQIKVLAAMAKERPRYSGWLSRALQILAQSIPRATRH